MTGVLVDVGKSAIRCWIDGERRTVEGLAPESAASAGAGETLAAGVRAAWDAHDRGPDDQRVSEVAIGTTFLPEQEELVAAGLQLRDLWPAATIGVAEDGVLAHGYALGGPGVVASAGTGTIVIGIDRAGRMFRADGWGPDLGDRGSAWAIGVAGLRAVYRERDGVGPATTLTREFTNHLDAAPDLTTATRLLGRADRVSRTAGFAVPVLAAARAGDPVAIAIVDEASADLVASVTSIAHRIDEASFALVGGLARDTHWSGIVTQRCRELGLDVRSAGGPSRFDPAVLLRPPYRAACAWWSSPDDPNAGTRPREEQ